MPNIVSSDNSYLVVEGVINSGGDSTIIHLSRTVKISGLPKANVLNNCTVTVENEQGDSYTLHGTGNGKYVSAALPIDAAKKYRLHIITNDSKEYASDYVAVTKTPQIDDLPFELPNNTIDSSLQVYVSTHDATDGPRYFRWDYTETWKIMPMYESTFVIDGFRIRERTPEEVEEANVCYQSDSSVNIYLGSSVKLAENVINRAPITQVRKETAKLKYRYSIEVSQYALTKDEYQFWDNIEKNNEQLGSIFDAQPSQISGNIHNVKDPGEPVIGYASVTNIAKKRIFITNSDVPSNGLADYPYKCDVDTAFYDPQVPGLPLPYDYYNITPTGTVLSTLLTSDNIASKHFEPIRILYVPFTSLILGYLYTTLECMDCRVRGTSVKPSYWVD